MKAVERIKDKIKVYTPIPYEVNLKERVYTEEEIKDLMYNLKQDVYFLRNILLVLGITNKKDKERYTLNTKTGEELYNIAIFKGGISNEVSNLIRKHKW